MHPLEIHLMILLECLGPAFKIAASGLYFAPLRCDGLSEAQRNLIAVLSVGASIEQPEVADLYAEAFGEHPKWVQQRNRNQPDRALA